MLNPPCAYSSDRLKQAMPGGVANHCARFQCQGALTTYGRGLSGDGRAARPAALRQVPRQIHLGQPPGQQQPPVVGHHAHRRPAGVEHAALCVPPRAPARLRDAARAGRRAGGRACRTRRSPATRARDGRGERRRRRRRESGSHGPPSRRAAPAHRPACPAAFITRGPNAWPRASPSNSPATGVTAGFPVPVTVGSAAHRRPGSTRSPRPFEPLRQTLREVEAQAVPRRRGNRRPPRSPPVARRRPAGACARPPP